MRCAPARPIALVLSFLFLGCTNYLPPPPVPDQTPPPLDPQSAPPEGHGRLVIDVVEGPTMVERVTMVADPVDGASGRQTWRFSESLDLLCGPSPCIADLPLGNHILGFPVIGNPEALQIELVHVTPEPTVYRRALTIDEGAGPGYVLGILGATFGGMAVVPGLVFLPIGIAQDKDGMIKGGAATLAAGGALLVLGIVGILTGRATKRSGASVHFPLHDGSRAPGP